MFPIKMIKCFVCEVEYKKYTCPKCLEPYCSVACYKLHKNSVECEEAAANNKKAKDNLLVTAEDEEPTIHVPFRTEDTVGPEKLQLLAQSESLKKLLYNPHLRNFLKDIDTATNPGKAMEFAMQEPLFVEFADECLKVIEPQTCSSNQNS